MICLFASSSKGQTVVVSEEMAFKTDFSYEMLPMANGDLLIFKDEVFEQSLISFNERMEKKWTKKLSFEKKRLGLIGLMPMDSFFHIYYYFREKSDIFIVSRRYSEDGSLISGDTLIQEKYQSGVPAYYFTESPKQKKALIFTVDRHDLIDGYCIDVRSNQVDWARKIEREDISIRKTFREVILTDDGEAYFLFEKDNRWTRRKKHEFELVHFKDENPGLVLPMPSLLNYDADIALSQDQETLYLASAYSEKTNNLCNGIYGYFIDLNSMKLLREGVIEFDRDMLTSPQLENLADKSGLPDLTVRYVVPRTDGGFLVLCESSKEYTRRPSFSSSSSVTRWWVDYYFEDIIAFSISPDFELSWYEVLHKKQYSQDDDAAFSSFFLFKTPAQLKVIYNDEIKSGNTVSEYILTSNGLLERKSLMSTDQQKLKLKFREAVQLSNQDILVPGIRNNKMVMVKISYDHFWMP